MPLDPKVLNSVVRISSAGDLRGTGSIIGVMSDLIPKRLWPYLITAHHVIRSQVLIEIEVPDPLTHGDLFEPVPVDNWEQPLPGVDLAIAPFPFDAPGIPRYQAFPLEYFVPDGSVVPLGGPILYLGIFAPLDRPMARAGNLAALDVPMKTDEYSYQADLVDCRSYGGFSGSPCLSTMSYVIWDSEAAEQPPSVVPQDRDGNPLRLGNTATIGRFCGMFTAHYHDENPEGAVSRYGVGVMLPSDYIRAALMTHEQARREADEALIEKAARTRPPEDADTITPGQTDELRER